MQHNANGPLGRPHHEGRINQRRCLGLLPQPVGMMTRCAGGGIQRLAQLKLLLLRGRQGTRRGRRLGGFAPHDEFRQSRRAL